MSGSEAPQNSECGEFFFVGYAYDGPRGEGGGVEYISIFQGTYLTQYGIPSYSK